MLKAWLAAAVFLTTAVMSSAATVSVEISINGSARIYNCLNLDCLRTGNGDGIVDDPENESAPSSYSFRQFSSSIRFAVPEEEFQFDYYSTPFQDTDYDLGRRSIYFSGDAIIDLVIDGAQFMFAAPIRFYAGEIWPAYSHRIYQTSGFFVEYALPIGNLALDFYGERSIPYVVTPSPHSGVPELNQAYRTLQYRNFINGGSFYLDLFPGTFNVKIDVEEVAPVPLPASGLMLALGLAGLTVYRRRKA